MLRDKNKTVECQGGITIYPGTRMICYNPSSMKHRVPVFEGSSVKDYLLQVSMINYRNWFLNRI